MLKTQKILAIFHDFKLRDSSSKFIFKDSTLCAQFLRDYTNIPQLKVVQPEDIEDVSERYIHMFAEYIPDYKCMLVQIKDYSSQKIMENKDELSILMLINKLRKAADFKTMEEEISPEYLKTVTENTPEYLLGIMAEVVSVLLSRLKLPQEEVDDFMGQIKERK